MSKRRVIPLSRRSHVTGYQPSVSGTGVVEHESALERDFVTLTRFDLSVLHIESQPESIYWTDESRRSHRYTPDYRIVRADQTEIVEVKYRDDLREGWVKLRPAFVAARDWCRRHDACFRIVTESGIRVPRLENAKRLLPLEAEHLNDLSGRRIFAFLGEGTRKAFSEVVDAVSSPEFPKGEVLTAMWMLLAKRKLLADFDHIIDGRTLVWMACEGGVSQ